MRTKSTGSLVVTVKPGGEQLFIWNNSTRNWDPYGSFSPYNCSLRNGSISTITYDDSKRTGKLKRTRKCLHTVVDIRNWMETHSHYQTEDLLYKKVYTAGGAYDTNSPTIPDLSSLHSEAFNFFKAGCVEKKFDLAADLAEWKQVTQLLPSLKRSISKILELRPSHLGRQGFKDTLKSLSDLHLSYAFGIEPLVSDIKDLLEVVKGLKDKITWLRKNQGKPVKVRFSKDLSTIYRPAGSKHVNVQRIHQDVVTDYSCKYTAYALMVYNVQSLSDLELQLRTLVHSFGLDKPLSTLYELTPWSFVLDWFVKVGDLIENFSPQISLPYQILDIGYYIKIRESREMGSHFLIPYKGDIYHPYGTVRKSLFFREPGLPTSFSIAMGDPGANQLALSISLAIQRWK